MRGLARLMVISGLLASGPVFAASFDCNAAKTLRERAICADAELSQADEALSAAYTTTRDAASEAYRAELLTQQRLWLRTTGEVCTAGRKDPKDEDLRQCLKSDIVNRTDFLKRATAQLGPYRFVQNWRMATAPDPDNADNAMWRLATAEVEWPVLEAPSSPKTDAFNAYVSRALHPEPLTISDPSQDSDLSLRPLRATAGLIVLQRTDYFYGHGAAHGNYAVSTLTWLVDQQRVVAAGDVFEGKAWPGLLADLVVAEFKRQNDGEAPWGERADLLKMVAEPERWSFSAKAITLSFNPYELASYAQGEIELDIPWSKLEPVLSKASKTLPVLREQ